MTNIDKKQLLKIQVYMIQKEIKPKKKYKKRTHKNKKIIYHETPKERIDNYFKGKVLKTYEKECNEIYKGLKDRNNVEVIGNIYENKDLIEGTKCKTK